MVRLGYILYIVVLVELVVFKRSVTSSNEISLTSITNTTMKCKIV